MMAERVVSLDSVAVVVECSNHRANRRSLWAAEQKSFSHTVERTLLPKGLGRLGGCVDDATKLHICHPPIHPSTHLAASTFFVVTKATASPEETTCLAADPLSYIAPHS